MCVAIEMFWTLFPADNPCGTAVPCVNGNANATVPVNGAVIGPEPVGTFRTTELVVLVTTCQFPIFAVGVTPNTDTHAFAEKGATARVGEKLSVKFGEEYVPEVTTNTAADIVPWIIKVPAVPAIMVKVTLEFVEEITVQVPLMSVIDDDVVPVI